MSNDKAVIYYESGQNAHAMEAMTSTDGKVFSASFKPFSAASGFDVKVMPVGLANGGAITPSSSSDEVIVAEALVIMPHVAASNSDGQLTVSGGLLSVSRPTGSDFIIHSVTVNASGSLSIVSGTEGSGFVETRGVSGGPPLIPVDSVEIGQVRLTSTSPGVISTGEIKQVPGLHQELSDFPVYEIDYENGAAIFAQELPAIHDGDAPKQVYVSGFTPIFAETPKGYDWVPSEESYSTSSQKVYGAAIGSTSTSLQQASFSAILKDGITDNILKAVGENIWVRFKQDRNRAPNQLTQGILGISRTFPADGNVVGAFTLSPESKTRDLAS